MTALQLAIGFLTLLTNAFFVGAEFALISVRRSQIEPQAREGHKRARITLWGLEHISQMMATAQLGITVSSLVLGAVAEPAIAHIQNRRTALLTRILGPRRFVIVMIRVVLHGQSSFGE